MTEFLLEYLPIVIFLGIAAVLGLLFIVAALVLAPKNPDSEKLSAYECARHCCNRQANLCARWCNGAHP